MRRFPFLYICILGVAYIIMFSIQMCIRDRDYIIGEFRKLSGTQFEPAAVKALVELLESGEIAVQ